MLPFIPRQGIRRFRPIGTRHIRMPGDPGQLACDRCGRQHEVHTAGQDSAPRHSVVLGGVILREGDAALRLDLLQAECAVVRCARQNHPDGLVTLVLRQGLQKLIDRVMDAAHFQPRPQLDHALRNDHAAVGWNHIHTIGAHCGFVAHLADRQLRGTR